MAAAEVDREAEAAVYRMLEPDRPEEDIQRMVSGQAEVDREAEAAVYRMLEPDRPEEDIQRMVSGQVEAPDVPLVSVPVPEDEAGPGDWVPPEPKGVGMGTKVALGLLGLVAAGGGGFLFLRRRGGQQAVDSRGRLDYNGSLWSP
mgnify:CR=1 FL=1|jgi:hypothetical protein